MRVTGSSAARPSDSAIRFEALKTSIRQDKNGYSLVLSIHPDEVPEELFRAWVGQRYVVAMVALSDDDQPMQKSVDSVSESLDSNEHLVSLAGQLCREERFHKWLYVMGFTEAPTEADSVAWLHEELGIGSRRELASDVEAANKFKDILHSYQKQF